MKRQDLNSANKRKAITEKQNNKLNRVIGRQTEAKDGCGQLTDFISASKGIKRT